MTIMFVCLGQLLAILAILAIRPVRYLFTGKHLLDRLPFSLQVTTQRFSPVW